MNCETLNALPCNQKVDPNKENYYIHKCGIMMKELKAISDGD